MFTQTVILIYYVKFHENRSICTWEGFVSDSSAQRQPSMGPNTFEKLPSRRQLNTFGRNCYSSLDANNVEGNVTVVDCKEVDAEELLRLIWEA